MLINSSNGLEQGREVFAVPGVAQSMRSKGTHRLLRQGAKLVESVEDVLEEIRPLIRPVQHAPSPFSEGEQGRNPSPLFPKEGWGDTRGFERPHSPEETILLKILDKVPKHIDEIAQGANMPVQRAAAILLELELTGLVSQLPGKYFIMN